MMSSPRATKCISLRAMRPPRSDWTVTRRDALKLGAGAACLAALGCDDGHPTRSGAWLRSEPLPAWTLENGAPLRRPGGIALLPDGRVVVAESGRHRLRVFAPDGRLEDTVGAAGSHPGQWNDPGDVTLIAAGGDGDPPRLAVADRANGRLVLLGADGSNPQVVGALGVDDDQFMGPSAVALGPDDPDRGGRLLVVADARNRRVKVIRSDGTPRAFFWAGNTLAPAPRLPIDVAMLPSGLCVAADPLAGALFAMQLVTADVRVAFAAPGATAIPERPMVHATTRLGFRSRLRICAMDDGVLVADTLGLALMDQELAVVAVLHHSQLGADGAIRPGGIAYDPGTQIVWVTDAATGTILRAKVWRA